MKKKNRQSKHKTRATRLLDPKKKEGGGGGVQSPKRGEVNRKKKIRGGVRKRYLWRFQSKKKKKVNCKKPDPLDLPTFLSLGIKKSAQKVGQG